MVNIAKIGSILTTFIALNCCTTVAAADWYQPNAFTSANIQLTGTLNTQYPVELYVVDLFDTPKTKIAELKARGTHVICYFSAGSYENWRPDKAKFPATLLGKKLTGWAGERWLDIRAPQLRTIMRARLNLAVQKGCDGVGPDNVNSYSNDTGFPLTARHQLSYNRFLATEAHQRNLSIGLKNDLEQIKSLVSVFDFSINEQCHTYNECHLLTPFVQAGKPVYNIEYQQRYIDDPAARKALCSDALSRGFRTLIMPPLLDGTFRLSCDDETL